MHYETKMVPEYSERTRRLRIRFEEVTRELYDRANVDSRAADLCEARGLYVEGGVVTDRGTPQAARWRCDGLSRDSRHAVFQRVGRRLETALDGLEALASDELAALRYQEFRDALAETVAQAAACRLYGDIYRDEGGTLREVTSPSHPHAWAQDRVQATLDATADAWVAWITAYAAFLASTPDWRGLTDGPELVGRKVAVYGG